MGGEQRERRERVRGASWGRSFSYLRISSNVRRWTTRFRRRAKLVRSLSLHSNFDRLPFPSRLRPSFRSQRPPLLTLRIDHSLDASFSISISLPLFLRHSCRPLAAPRRSAPWASKSLRSSHDQHQWQQPVRRTTSSPGPNPIPPRNLRITPRLISSIHLVPLWRGRRAIVFDQRARRVSRNMDSEEWREVELRRTAIGIGSLRLPVLSSLHPLRALSYLLLLVFPSPLHQASTASTTSKDGNTILEDSFDHLIKPVSSRTKLPLTKERTNELSFRNRRRRSIAVRKESMRIRRMWTIISISFLGVSLVTPPSLRTISYSPISKDLLLSSFDFFPFVLVSSIYSISSIYPVASRFSDLHRSLRRV